MRLRPILAIACKDALDLVLNKSTLAVLLIPLLVAVLFALLGVVLTPRPASLLIYNPGGSAVEQVLRAAFTNSQVTRAPSAEQVHRAFPTNAGHTTLPYTAGLVVPVDFEASLRAGKQASLEFYVAGDQVSSVVSGAGARPAGGRPLQNDQCWRRVYRGGGAVLSLSGAFRRANQPVRPEQRAEAGYPVPAQLLPGFRPVCGSGESGHLCCCLPRPQRGHAHRPGPLLARCLGFVAAGTNLGTGVGRGP